MLQSSEPSPGPRPLQSGAVDVPTRQRTPGPNSRTSEHPLKDSPLGRCIGASARLQSRARRGQQDRPGATVQKDSRSRFKRRKAAEPVGEGEGGGGGGCVQKSARAETLLRPGPSLQQETEESESPLSWCFLPLRDDALGPKAPKPQPSNHDPKDGSASSTLQCLQAQYLKPYKA